MDDKTDGPYRKDKEIHCRTGDESNVKRQDSPGWGPVRDYTCTIDLSVLFDKCDHDWFYLFQAMSKKKGETGFIFSF